MTEVSETPEPTMDQAILPTMFQLCLLPEAWPYVAAFIERQWPDFQVVQMPNEAVQTQEETDAGIRTYFMALRRP